jgi:Glycosyl hydrolases related to GH101 family, GH129
MPARLGIWGKPPGAAQEIALASPTDQAEQIASLKATKDSLSWHVPQKELTVEMRLSESDLATFTFDPRYRLPLFETVFHDSVISLDFVGVPLMKFTNLVQTRSLLLLLYNVPSLWSLDQKAVADYGARIKAMNGFFAPIHRRIGDKPLTRFEWLTPDRMVQQTEFANEIVMTANFSDRIFNGIPPRCIEARRLKEGNKNLYCPEP